MEYDQIIPLPKHVSCLPLILRDEGSGPSDSSYEALMFCAKDPLCTSLASS